MFRVIIAGCRTFDDYELLCHKCDLLFSRRKPTAIVCGEARGADSLGKKYAREHGIPVLSFPAHWNEYGNKAGYLRNMEMADHAEALIAFWDGRSRGTANMIQIAADRGMPYRIIRFDRENQEEN